MQVRKVYAVDTFELDVGFMIARRAIAVLDYEKLTFCDGGIPNLCFSSAISEVVREKTI